MPMGTYMTGTGRKTKHTDSEDTIILTVQNMRATGSRTSNMVKEKRSGPTTPSIRVSTAKERNTGTEGSTGQTAQLMKENS